MAVAISAPLTLISWNVNGIRAAARNGFRDWLAASGADIVCLQELKSVDEGFPRLEIEALGRALQPADRDDVHAERRQHHRGVGLIISKARVRRRSDGKSRIIRRDAGQRLTNLGLQ